jgi:hypothetical protein
VKSQKQFMWMILAAGMIFSFQNCGKGFHPAISESMSSSAKCTAKMRSEAAAFKLSPSELNCGDFNAYACERRIFGPDVPDLAESIKECLPGGRICIDVDVRQFNTAKARASGVVDAASFAPGGDYNHEEIHCYHRMVYRGISLFEGTADSIEESLAKAMAACEQAVEK